MDSFESGSCETKEVSTSLFQAGSTYIDSNITPSTIAITASQDVLGDFTV